MCVKGFLPIKTNYRIPQFVTQCRHSSQTSLSSIRFTIYHYYDIRSAIRFLNLRKESMVSILRQFVETYGSGVMTRQYVTNWVKLYKVSCTDTHDEEGSGIPSVIL